MVKKSLDAGNTKNVSVLFDLLFPPPPATLLVLGSSMAHTQYACGWIRPTQSDCRCGLSLFGLGTPTLLCESRITAYLQPVQVLCLTIKHVEQMGFLRWPRPALVNFFPPHAERLALISRHVLMQHGCIHQPSLSPSYLEQQPMARYAVLLSFPACNIEPTSQYYFLFFLLRARARRFPGHPDYKMPCILNVSLPSTVRVPRARLKRSNSYACITSLADNT